MVLAITPRSEHPISRKNIDDEALRVLKKSADLNKKEPEIYYQMGLVYEAKNENVSAKEMYLKALELNPRFCVAQEHLDRLVGK